MKVGGARMDKQTKSDIKFMKPKTPILYHSRRDFGEKKKYYSKSAGQEGGAPMSLAKITNMLCPVFSYKRIGFGNSWLNRAHNHLSGTFPLKAGTVKAMHWESGQQYWNEFVGLPMHNYGGTSEGHTDVFTYDGFHASISELLAKAADVRNDTQSALITRPTGTSNMIIGQNDVLNASVGPSYLKSWNGLSFDYMGGYQEHTFINTSEVMITIYLQEAQPREVMSGVMQDPDNQTKCKVRSIGRDVLVDYKSDLPLANTLRPMYTSLNNNNEATDELSDPCVKINSRCNNVHRKYLISKEEKVTLAPGDIYTHKMSFPAFNINQTSFANLSSSINDRQFTTVSSNLGPWSSIPMLIPMFTKILIVRAKSELGYQPNEAGLKIEGIGILGGSLGHTCTEKHTCRMLPTQVPYQTFIDYNLDGTGDGRGSINYVMNVETNKGDFVNDSGLAET